MTTDARVQPHNLDAERSVLGTVIVTSGKALDTVADLLKPHEFFRAPHQMIFRMMLALYAKGEPIDFVTLTHALKATGQLDECGGPAYVAGLTDGVPTATNAPYYARIVRETSDTRNVIALATRLLEQAYGGSESPAGLIDTAERGLLELSQQAVPDDLRSAEEMTLTIYPALESLWESKRTITGVETGISDLDYYTHGLQPGTLSILAGRPSTGKSSLALQMALHVAQSQSVAFFSVEMSEQEQMFRVLSTLAQVDSHQLQSGALSMVGQQDVGAVLAAFPSRRFYLDDSGSLSVVQIRSRARRLKAKQGLGLVVIDYLNLLKHERAETREQQIAASTRMLKQIARELHVPLLVLCQLNRQVETRADKRPTLADLRESGSIEQDADVVLLIWRPPTKTDGATTTTPPAELIIAKQRNGPIANIDLMFKGEHFAFQQMERRAC